MTVVMAIEGVLSDGPLPIAGPTLYGRAMYEEMRETSFILLSESRNPQLVREWLLTSQFSRWVGLVTMENEPVETTPIEWKKQILSGYLAAGLRPTLYIDADPEAVREASDIGIPSLLTVPPGPFPGLRDGFKPWDDLAGTIHERVLQKAEARRLLNG